MVEMVRDFKVTFYMDSNKRTATKTFDWDDYETISDLLDAVSELIKSIKENGVLEEL